MLFHVVFILAYTVLSIFVFIANGNWMSYATYYSLFTAWTFVGAASDLFITCMIWYILDENATPVVFKQGRFAYSVLDVIRVQSGEINDEDVQTLDDQKDNDSSHDSNRDS